MADLYISLDVEADGPIPNPYSMLQLGASVAGRLDMGVYTPMLDTRPGFAVNLKPMNPHIYNEDTVRFLAENGLDRDACIDCGLPPRFAMDEFRQWVASHSHLGKPVAVAYPLGFDWSFLYWYLVNYSDGQSPKDSPFGFSNHLDIKTLYAAAYKKEIRHSIKAKMPKRLTDNGIAHTHDAYDDAREQAALFNNLMMEMYP
jgi:hypothetical protein